MKTGQRVPRYPTPNSLAIDIAHYFGPFVTINEAILTLDFGVVRIP